MTTHVFAAFVTPLGTASNNRGVTEGNVTTLQKLIWNGRVHTTISAEAIRFALRRRLIESGEPCNRVYNDDLRANEWNDASFARWGEKSQEVPFADDDLLGYMQAEGAKKENEKGSAKVRRAVLEVTRAVSLTPWPGDVTFNAASPGATPSAQKGKVANPVPYGTEMHATRYQYGVALTPSRLRVPERAVKALRLLCAIGEVAGNHGRFLFDFSPDSVVFRVAQEPAPRILYAFGSDGHGQIGIHEILRKVRGGDIPANELTIGGAVATTLDTAARDVLRGAAIYDGVRPACEAVCKKIGAANA